MAINKIAKIPLETTAYYQALTKLNVSFWTQDKGTSTLQFIITRNNFPIALTGENVKVILALESEGSFISTDELDLDNEVEGVVTYTIPSAFLAVAKNVTGQIYVSVGDDETVVQRKFSFKVEEDLLSTIPSEEKIRYIKMFDDLKVDMEARLGTLDTALSRLEENVDAVNNARDNGVAAINNLHDAKTVTFNQNFDDKMVLINNAMDNVIDYAETALTDMTTKKEEFDSAVEGANLVTEEEALNWQKYKLTKDDGTRTYLSKGSFEDVHALEPGYYETVSNDTPTQGFPLEFSNSSYILIDVIMSSIGSGRKQITVTQSSRGQTFVKFLHTDGEDNGWKEIPYVNPADPYETVNSSQGKANTAENNAKQYTDSKVQSINTVLFEGTANGVNTTINLNESLDNFTVLYIFANFPGGIVPVLGNPYGTNNIPIQLTNLVDALGQGGGIYEAILSKTSRTQLKITNDVYFDLGSQQGSGANANKITITKIVGVRNI